MKAVSMLNLVPVRAGQTNAEAIGSMVKLAKEAEKLGYARYWIAEHHNTGSLVSSATQLLIGHTLAHTETIRVGSGGVMLPNHSPLLVAEQYGTLATIYPNRVDLGLGRAPGTDQLTAAALRRNERDVSLNFPDDVRALQRYFGPADKQGYVKAFPGVGLEVPLYILGSSTESAYLAAELGLPYVFAAHFAPRMLEMAVEIYRRGFKPSAVLDKPEVIVCLNAIVADSDEEAAYLATSQEQFFLNVVRNTRNPLPLPVESMEGVWSHAEEAMVRQMLSESLVGSKESVAKQLESFQSRLHADEVMAVSYIYDEEKQYRSYSLLKEIVSDGCIG
ncbi:LLM class flavin-dependent oxidoreductase [Neisseria sp. S1]|uniref:LLM class flavin-dependent oxidoreductase n=1 Tax=Neisseria sp. S1 TaxID=3318354 RepID=UPI003A849CE5